MTDSAARLARLRRKLAATDGPEDRADFEAPIAALEAQVESAESAREHAQTITGHAQVGVAVAGSLHGNVYLDGRRADQTAQLLADYLSTCAPIRDPACVRVRGRAGAQVPPARPQEVPHHGAFPHDQHHPVRGLQRPDAVYRYRPKHGEQSDELRPDDRPGLLPKPRSAICRPGRPAARGADGCLHTAAPTSSTSPRASSASPMSQGRFTNKLGLWLGRKPSLLFHYLLQAL
jgi:hypothetical protein